MSNFRKTVVGLFIALTVVLANTVQAQNNQIPSQRYVNYWKTPHHIKQVKREGFDIASIPQKVVFDEAPSFAEDQMPAHGNQFINQGYIYPYGFLDKHDGVADNGEPAFPEHVIGFWTCRGSFIADGAHTLAGPWIESTQYYEFYLKRGYEQGKFDTRASLVSEGYELVETDTAFFRAITGATGTMRDQFFGQVEQRFLGFTSSMGVKLRFRIR